MKDKKQQQKEKDLKTMEKMNFSSMRLTNKLKNLILPGKVEILLPHIQVDQGELSTLRLLQSIQMRRKISEKVAAFHYVPEASVSLSIERCTALVGGGGERMRPRVEVGKVEEGVVEELLKEVEKEDMELAKEEEEAKDEVMESISGITV